jgi:uncharacterized alpha-E superfamily protein
MLMLSRVADAIYWMARYLERAENISRFIEVNWHLTLDLPDLTLQQWEPLVSVTGERSFFYQKYATADQAAVIRFLTFDLDYPNSIVNCLRAARFNAGSVREIIPSEMWEQVNIFYHLIEEAARDPESILDNPYELCQNIKTRSLLLGGIANDAMTHGEGWHFFTMGRMLERADKTSRILDVKYFILLPNEKAVGTATDDIQWAALLRTTSALQAYRQNYGRILPGNVVEFLLLNRNFPRSVLHCLTRAQASLHEITGTPLGYFQNRAEQLLGNLCAELSYKKVEEVFRFGLHEFIDHLQTELNCVDRELWDNFSCKPQDGSGISMATQ